MRGRTSSIITRSDSSASRESNQIRGLLLLETTCVTLDPVCSIVRHDILPNRANSIPTLANFTDRSTMHHKKQKNCVGSGGPSKDAGFEAMQRLRYLNKKPLCLQYNVVNGHTRRQNQHKNKRREQSFVVIIAMGLIRLLQYVVTAVQTEFWDFVLKPADELFPSSLSQDKNSPRPIRRRPSLSKRYLNCTYRRDYGRTARITELREQRTQLCYF